MSTNSNLRLAKSLVDNEFYTRPEDIAKELKQYEPFFEKKIVYCNTDDPQSSYFAAYFHANFSKLKLTSLYVSCLGDSKIYEYTGGNDLDLSCYRTSTMAKDNSYAYGDFRSEPCKTLISVADIVVTNPPFSLFTDFISTILSADKDFIVVANMNSLSNKYIRDCIDKNVFRVGYTSPSLFDTPEGELRHINTLWFTTLPIVKNPEPFKGYTEYTEAHYPKYDEIPARNCNKVSEIPKDLPAGVVLGVPITIMTKLDTNQFETVKWDSDKFVPGFSCKSYKINSKKTYARVLIRRKEV